METKELRKKWTRAITQVDDHFLRLVDALHESYSKNDSGFFDDLPNEIKALLMESRDDIKNGNVFTHQNVMEEFNETYKISK